MPNAALPSLAATPATPVAPPLSPWRLCVAPMLDWTDRHCRTLHRLITRRTRLYTEMVTTGARHGDVARHLDFGDIERRWRCSSVAASPPTWRIAHAWPSAGATTRSLQLRLPERTRAAVPSGPA
ncbi:MAG: tRNA-dihydrouridine synthase [Rubrivivax sp.]